AEGRRGAGGEAHGGEIPRCDGDRVVAGPHAHRLTLNGTHAVAEVAQFCVRIATRPPFSYLREPAPAICWWPHRDDWRVPRCASRPTASRLKSPPPCATTSSPSWSGSSAIS